MDRIAVVAGALLAFGGVTHVQQGQRAPAAKVEAEGLPEEFKQKLADFVLNAQSHLAGEQFGLKPAGAGAVPASGSGRRNRAMPSCRDR